jgi:hypothetical protein
MNGLEQTLAFVLQFRGDRKHSGRIEHVDSGRTANFRSLRELTQVLREMLSEATERKSPSGIQSPSQKSTTRES